ncbi:amino acid permease [Solimonas marina]|uniref:Amino acid permease n=1 Tax=Solimonas marina TaxID=2714601 RepID=A0A970B7V6_9GAMM|nr:amino acid permease [Solimonas marina]NKF21624.1 amino acid permease [Solimonas marina]
MSLMRTKAIDPNAHTGLRRCLTAWDLTLLGIGCVIGTGIFVLTGVAAAEHAGPAIVLSFVLSGLACAFSALCYAELSSAIGGSGSAYGYAYAGIGEFPAWVIGWLLLLEYTVATATVSIGWSGYFAKILSGFFGIELPAEWTSSPSEGGICNVPAIVIVLVLAVLLSWGVKESARFNGVMVVIKLATIAIFIAIAAPHINTDNWTPFIPERVVDANGQSHFGVMGVATAAALIFFAYIGFDAVSTAGEEAINPQRDLPIGILASLAICTLLYIVVSGILTGVVPYTQIDLKAPIAAAMGTLGISWAQGLVATGAIFGITTVMLVLFYGLTRIVLAMSRDGLLPSPMARLHPRTQTPVRLIIGAGVVIALIAGLSPIGKVAELVNLGTLGAFFLVCLSVIVLRRTRPKMARPFRTPWVPLVPILGMGFCGALMASLPGLTWIAFSVWMVIGLLIYFLYSRHRSALATPTA